jgi:Winged helix-turn helix
MGRAIAVRTDYTSGEVRRLAQGAKDAGQARRLLAIAAVLDGSSREEAARLGGMDRQTLRDWVIRFNAQGPERLITRRARRPSSRLSTRPFSPRSWRKARFLRSMAWCAGGPAT